MKETTVKLALDTRSTNKKLDDTYPIKIRVMHKGKNDFVRLGHAYAVTINDWNKKEKKVRASAQVENPGRLRVKCGEKLKLAQQVLDNNTHLLESLTAKQIAKLIREVLRKSDSSTEAATTFESVDQVEKVIEKGLTLRQWADILKARKEKTGKFATAHWYSSAVTTLLNFYGDEDLLLKQINKSLLEDWKANYLAKGNKVGGINTNLRALRALLNFAVDEEKLAPENNPFSSYNPGKRKVKIPSAKPEKRAVDGEIIAGFKTLYREGKLIVHNKEGIEEIVQLKEGTADWHCVGEGIFMWETLAMNFIDLVKLKVKDVMGDVIEYERSKTGHDIHAISTDLSKEIIAYYSKDKSPEDFLFRYTWSMTKAGYKRYMQHIKRWNKRMTQLAQRMGHGDVKFSTYVIRHTLATTLNKNGVLSDDIGALYGHADNRSISTYIDKKDVRDLAAKAKAALSRANL